MEEIKYSYIFCKQTIFPKLCKKNLGVKIHERKVLSLGHGGGPGAKKPTINALSIPPPIYGHT